jgi:four helix bundle protein
MDLSNEKSPKIELFEFQNWDVYKKSLSLNKDLFLISKAIRLAGNRNLSDQLNRAASSISLNLAEGVSRYSLKEKMNFWRISKGSLFECVAIVDLIGLIAEIEMNNRERIYGQMVEVGKMLSGLIRWAEQEQRKG